MSFDGPFEIGILPRLSAFTASVISIPVISFSNLLVKSGSHFAALGFGPSW